MTVKLNFVSLTPEAIWMIWTVLQPALTCRHNRMFWGSGSRQQASLSIPLSWRTWFSGERPHIRSTFLLSWLHRCWGHKQWCWIWIKPYLRALFWVLFHIVGLFINEIVSPDVTRGLTWAIHPRECILEIIALKSGQNIFLLLRLNCLNEILGNKAAAKDQFNHQLIPH